MSSTDHDISLSPDAPPSVARLKALLRQILRVTILDGRIFLGTFVGTDNSLNVILISTEEYRIGQGESPLGRYVGQVMIPWRLVVKVEAPSRQAGLIGIGSDESDTQ